jgi:hypothetical protein
MFLRSLKFKLLGFNLLKFFEFYLFPTFDLVGPLVGDQHSLEIYVLEEVSGSISLLIVLDLEKEIWEEARIEWICTEHHIKEDNTNSPYITLF